MQSLRSTTASRLARVLLGVMLWGIAQGALAVDSVVDSVYATIGGDRHIVVYGVGIGSGPWWTTQVDSDKLLTLNGIANIDIWQAPSATMNKALVAIGAYPVLRLGLGTVSGIVPYVELGIGVNVLSQTWISDRRLATAFQFGEFAGVGATFGDKREFDLGMRYQHISNADIKRPNDGLSYASVVFLYRFGR